MHRRLVPVLIALLLLAGCAPTGAGQAAMDLTAVSPSGAVDQGDLRLRYAIEGQGAPVLVVGMATLAAHTLSSGLREHMQFIFADVMRTSETGTLEGVTMDTLVEAMDRLQETL
jgi:hypothetical protein